ncbi:MAG TPA: PP2C family protein-serine/threonine phosphatase [Candidatus Kapabacteria bacterium]|nr:PP2C family protein-serine/threonine phosphatase [Candidatus Kapabacteria bacterium]
MRIGQRGIYKLVQSVIQNESENDLSLLKAVVTTVVEYGALHIKGGRIWKLNENNDAYKLVFQTESDIEMLPEEYEVTVEHQPVFLMVAEKKSLVKKEMDKEFVSRGILMYSATGVGETLHRPSGKLCEYVLAFHADMLDDDFRSLLAVLGSATTNKLRNNRSFHERWKLKQDLDKASELQKSLLPDHTLEFHHYSIFGISVPDLEVGGDYFDYIKSQSDPDRVGIVISDAASKGMSAAIQALFVSGALRMGAKYHSKLSSLISNLNELLCATFPYERFVSLFYCELTAMENGVVLYVNAGHCAPILFSSRTRTLATVEPTGGILGVLPEQHFRVESFIMNNNDICILFTDGIIEAQNKRGEQYGYERLGRDILRLRHKSTKEIASSILESVVKFSTGGSYKDDSTIVVIKREDRETTIKTFPVVALKKKKHI